jgi:acyl dehydratase
MPHPLRIRAVNTAAESENKIHDDRVAAQYGFRGGLVPGVTVYGYLAAAVLDHFGEPWLSRGAMDVRFHQPVYEGEEAVVTLAADPANPDRVRVNIGDRATAVAWLEETGDRPTPVPRDLENHQPPIRRAPSAETLAPGTVLDPLWQPLDLAQSRMSAPLDPAITIGSGSCAHPAILIALANEIFVKNYTLGPWIHVSSEVRKFSPARDGERLYTTAKVEDRFERKGHEFVVLDVVIAAEANQAWRFVEQVRHTAIWRPREL